MRCRCTYVVCVGTAFTRVKVAKLDARVLGAASSTMLRCVLTFIIFTSAVHLSSGESYVGCFPAAGFTATSSATTVASCEAACAEARLPLFGMVRQVDVICGLAEMQSSSNYPFGCLARVWCLLQKHHACT